MSEAISDGEWERLSGMLSDSFFEYTPGEDEPTASARITDVLTALRRAMPDLEVAFSGHVPDGDLLKSTISVTGTHSNPLWGSPGSGNSVAWANPVTTRLIDDRVVIRFDDVAFPDLVPVLRQLELMNPVEEIQKPYVHPIAIPEFVLRLLMTGQAGSIECSHLGQILVTEPTTRMCAECVAEGTSWPALRMCLTCGFVGCCDMSKNQHMKQHHEATRHPLMRSVNMDEGWVWCYEDGAFMGKDLLGRYQV